MDRPATSWQIFSVFGMLLSVLVLIWIATNGFPFYLPDLYRFLLWCGTIGHLVLLVGICFRRRWALYGYFSLVLLMIPNAVIVAGPAVLTALSGPIILWVLVRKEWHQFD
ncbi:MAG: hypothetical protein M0Z65_06180 [Firmicutes bacterium]|uniref:Uncharacterized protein n=1 Tax=Melghirimyces thermohalophilus TaxID=1236220 RepID=A0A1G6MXC9_9BACL|nr:hypothetical protein [Melghirimyces thermohalophilus]MDA8352769.1 hypothetical protein [Bacillota bacterium]SDC60192.1 hypothetical protein SAMN04488112_11135 [Melghirimyces thermohalophilus]